MKNNKWLKKVVPVVASSAVVMAISSQAGAAITLYDADDTSFAVDGLLNTFLVSTEEKTATTTKKQARVKMGFLPNYIGFNYGKQAGDLKLGARSSFWVTINDSDIKRTSSHGVTNTGIDVRQFYATVGSSWGEVLIGKDFALFNRTNILGDEMLLGYGQSSGLVDGQNVSFGNIGAGYLYPFPVSQITYRSPMSGGFQIAIGALDPNKAGSSTTATADYEESAPRFEAEATFAGEFDGGSYKVWLGGMTQKSETYAAATTTSVNSSGVSGGLNVKFAGLSLTASGFDAEGVGGLGLSNALTTDNAKVKGYLTQASYSVGSERLVVSYGENDGGSTVGGNELDLENTAVAWFHKVNDNFQLVAEYDKAETKTTETTSIALGAVLTY